ncbi:hypothetical protein HRR78_007902 [Exophiala dermatitidis]|nr:hypothetical protein HRR75_000418 [Exophiala dermatitidis]KAJ4538977.1 hypothetical protein HRR78_007902 [Exophiala dermatitidis]
MAPLSVKIVASARHHVYTLPERDEKQEDIIWKCTRSWKKPFIAYTGTVGMDQDFLDPTLPSSSVMAQ